jgi:hypothetical protein
MANLALPDGKVAAGGYSSGQFFVAATAVSQTIDVWKKYTFELC